MLILSKIFLLIFPNSFFSGLMKKTFEWFKKFSLQFLNFIKQLDSALIPSYSNLVMWSFIDFFCLFIYCFLNVSIVFYRLKLLHLYALYCILLLIVCTFLTFCLQALRSSLITGLTLYLVLTFFIPDCVLSGFNNCRHFLRWIIKL